MSSKLLVSVRDPEEAHSVCGYPIGILDVKEPIRGALGAADPGILHAISHNICGQRPLSFSAGELSDWVGTGELPLNRRLESRYGSLLAIYDFVKIGLACMADCPNWQALWCQLVQGLPKTTNAVAVGYFDHQFCGAPPPTQMIDLAAGHRNCSTILFDTFHKKGNLLSYNENRDLIKLIDRAHYFDLTIVVAGSISKRCLTNVVAMRPDYIGVRGAVCKGERIGRISGRLVGELLDNMQLPITT